MLRTEFGRDVERMRRLIFHGMQFLRNAVLRVRLKTALF